MKRFHINEEGEAGRCRADEGNCPFGSSDQHFNSADEARAAYETQAEKLAEFRGTPLGKLDKATGSAIEKLKTGISKAVDWLDDHPKVVIGATIAIGVAVAAVVTYNLVNKHFAGMTSSPMNGTVVDGETKRGMVGIIGKGGSYQYENTYTIQGPDGITYPYSTGRSIMPKQLMAENSEVPLHLYSDGTVHAEALQDQKPVMLASSTIGAGVVGGGLGLVSGMLATSGITRLSDYLYSKWDMRYERAYGLTNWR